MNPSSYSNSLFCNGCISLAVLFFLLVSAVCYSQTGTQRSDADMKVEVSVIENYAILENSLLKIKYSQRTFKDSATNNIITELLIKSANNENQADSSGQVDGVWMGYGIGRGVLSNGSFIKYDGDDMKILHLEWGNGQVIQELTIYPDNPVIKIDYIKYGVNIVDIGLPGGSKGIYSFYGGVEWQQLRQSIKDTALINNSNEHHKLTGVLYPAYPNPIIDIPDWKGLEPTPMNYKGYIIMGLYNSKNGRGFGRVMPVNSINYLKLLWNRGFEGFPYWMGDGKKRGLRPAFTGYLFIVTGEANEIVNLGKSIADGTFY
ncbi:MAG: hypothetical protein IPK31_13450 [Chitinophagaceae bacterium]|nr:hypothetical protein [Chitinophagaceae bacterium]